MIETQINKDKKLTIRTTLESGKVYEEKTDLTLEDVLKELSRCNLHHVNDVEPPYKYSGQLCHILYAIVLEKAKMGGIELADQKVVFSDPA